ncbi:unnamed protein product [marine sediment metagenome]|uniref:Uncharacterized protein n=1 Tax=marine sediment metagenome TaxID=412755 RepID=X1FZ32_9ZZZZ
MSKKVLRKTKCDACGYFVYPVQLDNGMIKCPICNEEMCNMGGSCNPRTEFKKDNREACF